MRSRSAEKWEFWRVAVEMQRDSGLSVTEFCRREGLKASSFFAWRKRLEDDVVSVERSSGHEVATKFAEVSVVESVPIPIEVVAPNGIVVRLPESAGSDCLERVVTVLGRQSWGGD